MLPTRRAKLPNLVRHESNQDPLNLLIVVVAVVQALNHVRLFVAPWTAARHASLSFTNSRHLLTLMSTESVTPSNRLVLSPP